MPTPIHLNSQLYNKIMENKLVQDKVLVDQITEVMFHKIQLIQENERISIIKQINYCLIFYIIYYNIYI